MVKPSINPVITAVGGGPSPLVMSPMKVGVENHRVSLKEAVNSTNIGPKARTGIMNGIVESGMSRK